MLQTKTITILNGATDDYSVEGDYLAILETSYTGIIRVRTSNDDNVHMGLGDEVGFNSKFKKLYFEHDFIEPIRLKIAVGTGNDKYKTSRVFGSVSVINGEVSRVDSGVAFIGEVYCVGLAGNYSHVQLKNPIGSGKSFIVNKMFFHSPDVLNGVGFRFDVPDLSFFTKNGTNKKVGMADGVGELRYQNSTSALAGSQFASKSTALVRSVIEFDLSEPILLAPGKSITVFSDAMGATLLANYQWYEV